MFCSDSLRQHLLGLELVLGRRQSWEGVRTWFADTLFCQLCPPCLFYRRVIHHLLLLPCRGLRSWQLLLPGLLPASLTPPCMETWAWASDPAACAGLVLDA